MAYAYLLNGKTSDEPVFNMKIADLPIATIDLLLDGFTAFDLQL